MWNGTKETNESENNKQTSILQLHQTRTNHGVLISLNLPPLNSSKNPMIKENKILLVNNDGNNTNKEETTTIPQQPRKEHTNRNVILFPNSPPLHGLQCPGNE